MAILDLSTAKNYLRIDGSEHDVDLMRAISSAEAYILNYTGKSFTGGNAMAVECALMLTYQFFQNRGGVTEAKYKAMDMGIMDHLVKLRNTEAS